MPKISIRFYNNRANDFLGWFIYNNSTIDGQSRKIA